MIQHTPRTTSQAFVLWISLNIDTHCWRKVLPFTVILKMSFICDVNMIKATADVKPDETGPDTKSIKNPEM